MGALAHNLHVVAPGNWKLLLLDPGQWCASIFSILKYLMITHFEAVLFVENNTSNRKQDSLGTKISPTWDFKNFNDHTF